MIEKKISFIIFWILVNVKQTIQMTTIKKAKELTLVCNRNIIHSLLKTDDKFEKEQKHRPSELINSYCPNIQVVCCSEEEIKRLNEQIDSKMQQFDSIKSEIEKIYSIFESNDITAISFVEILKYLDNEQCVKNMRDGKVLSQVFNIPKESIISKMRDYFTDSERNFKGIVCSVCDARKNKFLLPVQRQNKAKPELKMTIKAQSCVSHFNMLSSYFDVIDFVYTLMEVSDIFLCSREIENKFFNDYSYSEFQEMKQEVERCISLKPTEMLEDIKCKEICILLHNFVIWDDMLDTFVILERVRMALILIFNDEDEKDKNNFIHKNDYLKYIFDVPENPEYDLKHNYLVSIEMEDGIVPFKETTPYYDFLFEKLNGSNLWCSLVLVLILFWL